MILFILPTAKPLEILTLAYLLSSAGNYESSTKAFFTAYDQAKICGARRLESICLNNIGNNFSSLKDFNKSRKYTLQALEINISLKAWRGAALNYENLFDCDSSRVFIKRPASTWIAECIISDSCRKTIFIPGTTWVTENYRQFTNTMIPQNIILIKQLPLPGSPGELRNEFEAYVAEAKYLEHVPVKAKTAMLKRALQLAEQTSYAEGRAEADEQLSSIYDSVNNKDSALFYYRSYRSITDSLFSENNRRNTIVNESEWTDQKKGT